MMTMTSRKTSLLVLVVVTGVTVQSVGGYVEKVQEWGCHTKDIKLTCRDLNAQIAILEAFFMSNTTAANISCTAVADSRTTSEYPTSLTVEGDSENVTSITSTTSYLRAVREAAISNELQEQIRLPVKHR
ncbi:hypothetical protein C0J52_26636 [Blattella germanica]|nr:hypothetical protein C0J52_26636 [Blattella germanica]